MDEPDFRVIPLLPARPETTCESHDGTSQVTMAVEPGEASERNGHLERDEPGRWLPLRDALRVVGSLDYLYHLARDGKLEPRAEEDGQVVVWLSDRDCSGGAPAQSLDATRHAEPLAPEFSAHPEVGCRVTAIIAPLVESHERHLELARENGILTERVARLQHQLQELTDRHGD
jgi:hypothetical protein